jgi:hypothetical protein
MYGSGVNVLHVNTHPDGEDAMQLRREVGGTLLVLWKPFQGEQRVIAVRRYDPPDEGGVGNWSGYSRNPSHYLPSLSSFVYSRRRCVWSRTIGRYVLPSIFGN